MHTELQAKQAAAKANAAAERAAKRHRKADGIETQHGRISTVDEIASLDWRAVLAQCRLRHQRPHPALGKLGKPVIGQPGVAGDAKRRMSLTAVLLAEAQHNPSSSV